MISALRVCPKCGGEIPADAPEGGCPGCLLESGLRLLGDEGVVPHSRDDRAQDEGARSADINSEDDLDSLLPSDARFGVYEIERRADGSFDELGRGGMGVTYRAMDTSLQRKVALKVIRTGIAKRSASAQERFLREARAAAALRHEHIATVFQFGICEETGQFFYAMELIEGETLEERVRRAGPLGVRTTIDIAQQVTSALAAAEKRSLIHRDLKPSNLMLISQEDALVGTERWTARRARAADSSVVVKIIDFGLAKVLNAPVDAIHPTHDGFLGTPAFASPEQCDNCVLDVRSDIYSLGVTLWFALTGKPPFGGQSLEEIRRAQQSDVLPVEQLKAARVPSRLRSLLKSILAFEPACRPGTHELAAQLQRCVAEAQGERRASVALTAAAILIVGASGFLIFVSLRIGNAPAHRFGVPGRPAPTVQNSPSNLAAPEKSLAVLPFENLSEDPNNAYFTDGVQEEILTRLATIADLKIISHTSTQRYQSKPGNLAEIAKQLGVANILEGGVQRAADQVRVNVRLINAQTDSHLWAESYDRKLTDILGVESEIAKRIAESLQAKLSGQEKQMISAQPTSDTAAYELYLKGRSLWGKRGGDNLRRAIAFYEQAIARDPNYALAYVGLAESYAILPVYTATAPGDVYPKAKAAALKALQLDDKLGEAHTALGNLLYNDFDMAGSVAEFQRAIALNPNSATAHAWYGNNPLAALGRFDEAIAEGKRAIQLDPLSPIINADLGQNLYFARRYDEAIAQLRKTLEIDPTFYYARVVLGLALQLKGDVPAAIAEFEKAQQLNDDLSPRVRLAVAKAKLGDKEAAARMLAELAEVSRYRYVDAYLRALLNLSLNNREEAIRWLEQGVAYHEVHSIKVNPMLDPLRGDPRFEALVQKVVGPKQK